MTSCPPSTVLSTYCSRKISFSHLTCRYNTSWHQVTDMKALHQWSIVEQTYDMNALDLNLNSRTLAKLQLSPPDPLLWVL